MQGDGSFLLQPGRELEDARKQYTERARDFSPEEQTFICKSLEAAEENAWRATLAAGDEERTLAQWELLERNYPEMRERVLADRLAIGKVNERRQAALLLGTIPPRPLTKELARLVSDEEENDAGRRAAAYSLMRLDDVQLCADAAAPPHRKPHDHQALVAALQRRLPEFLPPPAPSLSLHRKTHRILRVLEGLSGLASPVVGYAPAS